MHPAARTWFTRRTTAVSDWPRARVQAHKGDQRVTVIIPARDEESTVGAIVAAGGGRTEGGGGGGRAGV